MDGFSPPSRPNSLKPPLPLPIARPILPPIVGQKIPTSIPDLIDRLIAVNSDVKIHSLFHYEQSHTFGLRLLNVLCCSLDSFLLLENQYNICSMLLQSQRDNITDSDINEGYRFLIVKNLK
ncbi:protein broad-minded-like [Oryzias latipes]|uniref:protein broad-minded-like n=1 Tax=Oryzias latipes TaxID=8090 RepID=UPI000CE16F14|nr:protein broad-minded-like [Oryzias latipes]